MGTQINILCFNTSLYKQGATFDRHQEVVESIRDVEQKSNSELFRAYIAECIVKSVNTDHERSNILTGLRAVVESLFRDYYDRIKYFRDNDKLKMIYDIAYWEKEVFSCLYNRFALPENVDTQWRNNYLLRNSLILYARELSLRNKVLLIDPGKFISGVIPFDFWKGEDGDSGRERRLAGANKDYCASHMKDLQSKYANATRYDTQYHPYNRFLSDNVKLMAGEWNGLYKIYSAKISSSGLSREEYFKRQMFWFISAYNVISNISGTIGATPENLYRFEFNHVALWMSVVRLEIGFLQDFIEKPFLSMETSHSSRGPHEIRHFICEGTRSADQILEALHSLIEGNDGQTFRKGKEVAKIIRAAYIAGLLSQSPVPYATMKMEFPNIGAESGYYKYFDKARMKDAEFQPLIDKLKDFAKER